MAARITLVLFLAIVFGSLARAQDAPKRLNVLFLLSDDMRPDLGCYGHPLVKSPNIDALAQRGVRFDRAYCQYPLCNPSRTSMLTGRLPTATGVLNNTVYFRDAHPDWTTLPEHFKKHGYVALRTGKIFHGGIDDAQSWTEGGDPPRPPGAPPRQRPNQAQRRMTSDRIVTLEGDGEAHGDFKTADRAIEYLQKYKDKPFFLACGFTKPHSPPTAPEKYFDLYDVARVPLPKTFAATVTVPDGFPKSCLTPNGDLFIGREASEEEARAMIRAYWASISWVDWNVGRVLAELDRLGLRENTVIVFWGDHGYHLGEYGKWSKHGSLFEVGTRVPLIISAPASALGPAPAGRGPRGQAALPPVQTLDIYPTLCDLCGLPVPEGLHGHSLRPLLTNPIAAWEHPAFSVAGNEQNLGLAVRTAKYRYAQWNDGKNGTMLFDVTGDPHETRNLADDPKFADVRKELAELVKALPK